MRTHTLMRPLAAALLTTTGLALAACGADDPADARPSAADAREAQLEFAKCMREHGIDMPDPKPGQGGIQLSVPKGTSPDKVDAADRACRKYLDKFKPPPMSEAQQKEFRDAALAHARCMRDHGIDMPDPTFGPNGQATIRIRGKGGPGRNGLDPEDPKFQEAQKACEKLLPELKGGDGGPSTSSSGGRP